MSLMKASLPDPVPVAAIFLWLFLIIVLVDTLQLPVEIACILITGVSIGFF